MERRKFLTGAAVGAGAAALASPAISGGHTKVMTVVSTWPRDFPGLGISAQRFCQRVNEISGGAITTEYFAAGERVGAFDSFDEVSSGNAHAYIKGLKMRMPGLGGQVITKMGASSVSLPGGQIYENLVSGAIEATEWVGPYNDYFMKFYEAAKYYYTGGMHEPGGGLALGLNAEWWGSLSDTERAIITAAANEEHAAAHDEAMAKNGEYLQKLIDEQGVQVRAFNEDVWDGFAEAAEEVFEETRAHSAMAAKIDDNFQAKLREIGGSIASFEGQFVTQRNRILGLG